MKLLRVVAKATPFQRLPGTDVELDESGFLVDSWAWTPEVAERLAVECGVGPLGPRHWRLLLCCREAVAREGLMPALGEVARLAELTPAEIHRLFLHRPLELLPRIAGLPRPASFETASESIC